MKKLAIASIFLIFSFVFVAIILMDKTEIGPEILKFKDEHLKLFRKSDYPLQNSDTPIIEFVKKHNTYVQNSDLFFRGKPSSREITESTKLMNIERSSLKWSTKSDIINDPRKLWRLQKYFKSFLAALTADAQYLESAKPYQCDDKKEPFFLSEDHICPEIHDISFNIFILGAMFYSLVEPDEENYEKILTQFYNSHLSKSKFALNEKVQEQLLYWQLTTLEILSFILNQKEVNISESLQEKTYLIINKITPPSVEDLILATKKKYALSIRNDLKFQQLMEEGKIELPIFIARIPPSSFSRFLAGLGVHKIVFSVPELVNLTYKLYHLHLDALNKFYRSKGLLLEVKEIEAFFKNIELSHDLPYAEFAREHARHVFTIRNNWESVKRDYENIQFNRLSILNLKQELLNQQ